MHNIDRAGQELIKNKFIPFERTENRISSRVEEALQINSKMIKKAALHSVVYVEASLRAFSYVSLKPFLTKIKCRANFSLFSIKIKQKDLKNFQKDF